MPKPSCNFKLISENYHTTYVHSYFVDEIDIKFWRHNRHALYALQHTYVDSNALCSGCNHQQWSTWVLLIGAKNPYNMPQPSPAALITCMSHSMHMLALCIPRQTLYISYATIGLHISVYDMHDCTCTLKCIQWRIRDLQTDMGQGRAP